MLNLATDMNQRPGLDANHWYEAKVVDNKDPDQLGRIKARVATIFDGIKDADLPWSIPVWNHVDGGSSFSGVFAVPKIGNKVMLKFQQGNASFPMYRGYHVDKKTRMAEVKENYPDRAVVRFKNKAMMIVDTKANIVYLRQPGNLKIYISGNVELEIKGNVDEKVHGNVRRTVVGNVSEHIQGNYIRQIDGNLDENVSGNHHTQVAGELKEGVGGTLQRHAAGSANYESSGTFAVEGAPIHENSGMAKGSPGSAQAHEEAQFTCWPGVPGGPCGANVVESKSEAAAAAAAACGGCSGGCSGCSGGCSGCSGGCSKLNSEVKSGNVSTETVSSCCGSTKALGTQSTALASTTVEARSVVSDTMASIRGVNAEIQVTKAEATKFINEPKNLLATLTNQLAPVFAINQNMLAMSSVANQVSPDKGQAALKTEVAATTSAINESLVPISEQWNDIVSYLTTGQEAVNVPDTAGTELVAKLHERMLTAQTKEDIQSVLYEELQKPQPSYIGRKALIDFRSSDPDLYLKLSDALARIVASDKTTPQIA